MGKKAKVRQRFYQVAGTSDLPFLVESSLNNGIETFRARLRDGRTVILTADMEVWPFYRCCRAVDQKVSSDFMSKFIKRATEIVNKSTKAQVPSDAGMKKAYPALFDFLTVTEVDGKARKTSTLNVFTQDGYFKAFLNDRDSNACLCVASPTLEGLWKVLEDTLTAEDPGWRTMDANGGTRRGGKRP